MDKRQVISWCLYDFANSTYSAVIAAVVFPVYFANVVVGNEAGLGDLWWGRTLAISMVLVALLSPLLGGLADYAGLRKRFLFVFTMLSVSAVAMMSVLEKGMVVEGVLIAVAANVGMEGALVFYNSFLVEIAPKTHQGRLSSWGFGLGYLGSITALLVVLPLVKAGAFPYAWLTVSLLFTAFSIPAFLYLPRDTSHMPLFRAARQGLSYTMNTMKTLLSDAGARRFLMAYLVYADGVNTVIAFSSIYAAKTLGFKAAELIVLFIVVQVTALAGSFIMARPVDYIGPKKVVMGSLVMWTLVCVVAYFIETREGFWALAVGAGLSLGTVQAASRALFAQFIPEGKESEYFGAYSLAGKSSSILGPLVFGAVSVGYSQRLAILFVALFFLVGLGVLASVKGGGPNVVKQTGT